MNILTYSWYDPQLGLCWTETEACEILHCSRSRVRRVLGEPDAFGANPRGGAYVRLYAQERVQRARLQVVEKN